MVRLSDRFENAKTKETALKKISHFYKGIYGKHVKIVITAWRSSPCDQYGSNYWFDGFVLEKKER